jgi:hypothetical protein
MPQIIVLIADDPGRADEVIHAWYEAGVTGATSLDAAGARQSLAGEFREDLPLIPSLADLLQGREEHKRLIFSVVADDFDIDGLAARTEAILGRLSDPHTGILFSLPVARAWGLRPPRPR